MRAVSKEDGVLIGRLVERLERELPEYFDAENRVHTTVRLFEVHTTVPLELQLMLEGRISDVAHDIGLCLNKWDSEQKVFTDCSWPRFAKEQG
jgi:hypothetical protein